MFSALVLTLLWSLAPGCTLDQTAFGEDSTTDDDDDDDDDDVTDDDLTDDAGTDADDDAPDDDVAADDAADDDAADDDIPDDDVPDDDAADDDAADDDVADDDAPDDDAADDDATDDDATDDDATDDDATMTCGAGEHYCDGSGCVSNYVPESCGSSCSPCKIPTGGQVACDGTSCIPACPDTFQLCAGTCIPGAQACDMTCPADTTSCDGICAELTDPTRCGADCKLCPVPPGAAAALCVDGECSFSCPSDSHSCGDSCVANDDPTACGASCVACPTDAHGTASCAGGVCSIECDTNYHECAGTCVPDDDVTACGAGCETCVAPPGGSVECFEGQCRGRCPDGTSLCAGECQSDGLSCEGVCPSGSHDCSGDCLADDSPASCGARCTPCPSPTIGGTATCTAGACGLSCSLGYHECANDCVDNGDVAHCGASCSPCVAPAGGSVSCDGSTCQPACPSGTRLCGGSCLNDELACDGTCPASRHLCDEHCFENSLSSGCEPLIWQGEAELGVHSVVTSHVVTLTNVSTYTVTGLDMRLGVAATGECPLPPTGMWKELSNTCGTSLAAGTSCTITLELNPKLGAAGNCYQGYLTTTLNEYSYNIAHAFIVETPKTSTYVWQIDTNSATWDFDNAAPAVFAPCTTPGEVRDARATELRSGRRYLYSFSTDPPSTGSCSVPQYEVQSCRSFRGPTCDELVEDATCSIVCTDDSVPDTGCREIYYQLVCE